MPTGFNMFLHKIYKLHCDKLKDIFGFHGNGCGVVSSVLACYKTNLGFNSCNRQNNVWFYSVTLPLLVRGDGKPVRGNTHLFCE